MLRNSEDSVAPVALGATAKAGIIHAQLSLATRARNGQSHGVNLSLGGEKRIFKRQSRNRTLSIWGCLAYFVNRIGGV